MASGQEKLIRFGRSPAEVTTAWADQSRITYRVLLDRPQTQTVDIRIEVDDVSQPQLDFVLPTWRPGRYIVLDFAGSVSQVVATDGGGRELEMGTAVDTNEAQAHHGRTDVSEAAQRNRLTLLGLMTAAGWDNYRYEWWHYQLFDARRYPLLSDRAAGTRMM